MSNEPIKTFGEIAEEMHVDVETLIAASFWKLIFSGQPQS